MSPGLPPALPASPLPPATHPPPAEAADAEALSARSRPGRMAWGVVQLLICVLCVQSILGALLLLGWSTRWMRRAGIRSWVRRSRFGSLPVAGQQVLSLRDLRYWPNLCLGQRESPLPWQAGWTARIRRTIHRLIGSLTANLRSGCQMLFNTAVMTLPGTLLMQFSWYDGWNNSFNKGYEQAVVGPALGWIGILLFIASMYYVPMAQARQSLTQDWRTFYDFRFLWRLIRTNWLPSACLAGAYALLALPVTVLKTAPGFFPQMGAQLANSSTEQAIDLLKGYFLACAVVFVPIFLLLRGAAAKAYAHAILRGVQSGAVADCDLAEDEWKVLNDLGLMHPAIPGTPPRWRRLAHWLGTRTGQCLSGAAILIFWAAYVLQIYVGEFLLYHPNIGFALQPLIQLPFFHYVVGGPLLTQ